MKHNILLFSLVVIAISLSSCKAVKQTTTTEHPPLIGTHWNITVIEGQPVAKNIEEQPFIVFDTNGRYYGNLGCNSFFGEYYAKKDKIELNYAGSTKKLCQDMSTERAMTKALKDDINSYSFQQNVLILYFDKKEVMRLEKGDE